jgi:hypothetical protein
MLIQNIDSKVGAANGTIEIVTKLEFDLEDNVCNIFVAFNHQDVCANSLEKINSKQI